MHLFAVSDLETYANKISYWSDVYGFKMNAMRESVRHDAQVLVLEPSCVASKLFKFKEIDCMQVQADELNKFNVPFELKITSDCDLTGIGASFDTFFNHSSLSEKVYFDSLLTVF